MVQGCSTGVLQKKNNNLKKEIMCDKHISFILYLQTSAKAGFTHAGCACVVFARVSAGASGFLPQSRDTEDRN